MISPPTRSLGQASSVKMIRIVTRNRFVINRLSLNCHDLVDVASPSVMFIVDDYFLVIWKLEGSFPIIDFIPIMVQ